MLSKLRRWAIRKLGGYVEEPGTINVGALTYGRERGLPGYGIGRGVKVRERIDYPPAIDPEARIAEIEQERDEPQWEDLTTP